MPSEMNPPARPNFRRQCERGTVISVLALSLSWVVGIGAATADDTPAKSVRPNVLFILADDLGYGDLGCYGQRLVQTPHLDRLAADGIRFTQCYAGSTVCAPSRCSLMTGLHTGHGRVRGNAALPLTPEDRTVAEILHQAGYATGIIGKWGLGEPGTTGVPNRQGFDEWLGFLNQVHAHNYYPDYLWHNEQKIELANVVQKGVASRREKYAPDVFIEAGLAFLEQHRDGPFFLYYASTLPHANNEAKSQGMEIPSDEPYSDRDWPAAQKNHAAMITRLDSDVGRLLAQLQELGLADNTLVFFSSDNGPHAEGGADPKFFSSSGGLRGIKRDLYEGGIRVPMLVRWPGVIPPHQTNDEPWAFWDVLPTLAEMAGLPLPGGLDGISMWPSLVGAERAGHAQAAHGPLYWEFHENGFLQAVRDGRWKAVRKLQNPIELYNLTTDPAEADDLAADHPEIVAKMAGLMRSMRTPAADWPVTEDQLPASNQPPAGGR